MVGFSEYMVELGCVDLDAGCVGSLCSACNCCTVLAVVDLCSDSWEAVLRARGYGSLVFGSLRLSGSHELDHSEQLTYSQV